jgi:hypothetical protein
MNDEEKLPISEVLKVIDRVDIYKTDKWWSAVVLLESYGRKQVAVYVWNNRNGEWKRRQKFVITRKQQWEQVKPKIEEFVAKL